MTTALVLSGGGARCCAHIGVLKALDELEVKINAISAVSAGALIAAFYCAGFSTADMLEIAHEIDLFRLRNFRLGRKGFFSATPISNIIESHLKVKTFEDLHLPLIVAATDFINVRTDYFQSGDLLHALLASSSIPAIFEPEFIDGKMYVDGGLLNNLPVEPVTGKYDVIIGSHVNPVATDITDFGIISIIERGFLLAISNSVKGAAGYCSVFIEPSELCRFRLFDLKHAKQMMEIGYNSTMMQREKIISFYT
jgi:NTE family protein